MTSIPRRKINGCMHPSSPPSSSEISSIQPRQHIILKERIHSLEDQMQNLYENRKTNVVEIRKLVSSLQQQVKEAKEFLAVKIKEEKLRRIQGEVVADESNEANQTLMVVNRRSSKRFERRRQLNNRKVQIAKEIDKMLKDSERYTVSRKVLKEQLSQMSRSQQELLGRQGQVLKEHENVLKKLKIWSQKCDDERGIFRILSEAHSQAEKRSVEQLNLIAQAQRVRKQLQQIVQFNSNEAEKYNSLVRKQQIKNQQRVHHIENRKLEESMLDQQLQSLKRQAEQKQQVLKQVSQIFRQFSHGIELLQKFLKQAQIQRALYQSTNDTLMKDIQGISSEQITVAHYIEDSKQKRGQIITRFEKLLH